MYKGWNYTINGYSGWNDFEVIISPDLEISLGLSFYLAEQEIQQKRTFYYKKIHSTGSPLFDAINELKQEQDKDYMELYTEEGKQKIQNKWLTKIAGIKIRKVFQQPSGLFTSFENRKKEVETQTLRYIDSELGDFMTWLKKNPSRLE